MRSYQKLVVWKEAMSLAKTVYMLAREFPEDEQRGIGLQLRRAALYVPYNIARGHERKRPTDLLRFVTASLDSTAEIETLLILSAELGYISTIELQDAQLVVDNVVQHLTGMREALTRTAKGME